MGKRLMTSQDGLLDLAMGKQQDAIDHQIRIAQKKAKDAPKADGRCLYCEEQINIGRRFCDADCAEDAEKYNLV
jgi:hypothetical protein